MLPTLKSLVRRRPASPDDAQLPLPLEAPPRTAAELQARLVALGLRDIERVRLTNNRTVMVSFSGRELRIHEGYLGAPEPVLRAVVGFVTGRTRAERRQARARILAYHIERPTAARRAEATRPEDEPLVRELAAWHARFNARHFGGALRPLPVRVSRRMRTRLGHYTAASPTGDAAEIVISRRHVQRHGWDEALHTLLHEMVHQWQDESGQPVDHGPGFRAKAREVGIIPSARRTVVARAERAGRPERAATHDAIGLRAARDE